MRISTIPGSIRVLVSTPAGNRPLQTEGGLESNKSGFRHGEDRPPESDLVSLRRIGRVMAT